MHQDKGIFFFVHNRPCKILNNFRNMNRFLEYFISFVERLSGKRQTPTYSARFDKDWVSKLIATDLYTVDDRSKIDIVFNVKREYEWEFFNKNLLIPVSGTCCLSISSLAELREILARTNGPGKRYIIAYDINKRILKAARKMCASATCILIQSKHI